MNSTLKSLYDKKLLRDIDIQFAERMAEVFDADYAETFLALLFYAVSSANTCVDVNKPDIFPFYSEYKSEIDNAFSDDNISAMKQARIITEAPDIFAPVIKSGDRLYLKSFYLDEQSVREYILSSVDTTYSYEKDKLKSLLEKYFGNGADMQKAAALNACLRKFCVISGGPGTGKTTTVFNVLAILSELSEKPLMIAAAAPTGKAASRLSESITAKTAGREDTFISCIPQKAHTLHRLLKMRGGSGRAQYNSQNPMPYDIVVVDEASMVDIHMMATLVRAMKSDGRLIMLGDKDQLASVQPGNVLGDICQASGTEIFTQTTAELMSDCASTPVDGTAESALADITIQLTVSRRFDSDKGIGLLSSSCRRGDIKTVLDLVENDPTKQVELIDFDKAKDFLNKQILNYYGDISGSASPEDALKAAGSFRILSPHARGHLGAENINTMALSLLASRGLVDGTKKYFHGLPVIITENDYNIGLFNGDTGVIFNNDGLRAYFDDEDSARAVSVLRMPEWSPVFAMTAHKSQGSEFDHVVLILPDVESPVMTRELFYTAATRAKVNLTIIANKSAIASCISRTISRNSGLFV